MLVRSLVVVLAAVVLLEAVLLGLLVVHAHRQPPTLDRFRCRFREPEARCGKGGVRWRSRRGWASWARTVLVVRSGPLGRVDVLSVRSAEGSVLPTSSLRAKGLGPAPVVVLLRLEDDRVIELAAPGKARDLLPGPFLAACVTAPNRRSSRG